MLSLNNYLTIRHLLHPPASQFLQRGDRDKSERFRVLLQEATSTKHLVSSAAPRGLVEDIFSAVLK